jgi:hypothetical protein
MHDACVSFGPFIVNIIPRLAAWADAVIVIGVVIVVGAVAAVVVVLFLRRQHQGQELKAPLTENAHV